jgi:bis(5'-nucleosyl)-tetraphosphatase (symmetrical)
MTTWAIGDLQGCRGAFLRLLEAIDFSPARDRLWLTGDLVNRGPDSAGTLRAVMALGSAATTVLGNHDLHLLAVAMAPGAGRGQKPGDTLTDILEAPDREVLLAWLLAQPLLHHDATLDWTLVHAGLPPQWTVAEAAAEARATEARLREDPAAFFAAMYGDQPDRWDPTLAGVERSRFTVNCLTRLRYCTAEGKLLPRLKGPPAEAPAEAWPWFRVPSRHSAGQRVVFGHWSALGLMRANDALALDTGCVWGGRLTAVRLDGTRNQPPEDWTVVQVPAG